MVGQSYTTGVHTWKIQPVTQGTFNRVGKVTSVGQGAIHYLRYALFWGGNGGGSGTAHAKKIAKEGPQKCGLF